MKESIKNVTGFILFVIGAALMICGREPFYEN